jgi:mucin-19
MANGGIIGPANDPVINDLITTATASTPGFSVNPASSSIDVLIVAGGGNANPGGQAGAGGAGGYRYFTGVPVVGGNPYPLVVGAASSNSSAFGYTASGGGNGVAPRGASPGEPGGSGGGCGDFFPGGGGSGGSGNSGGFTPPEGNPGSGASPSGNNGETPGAGGGSSTAGSIGTNPVSGPFTAIGGQGTPNSITGTDLYYATGGFYPAGPPASPVAEAQGYPSNANPSAANTGNGAQGEGPYSGGSGIVVVSEPGVGAFIASGVWTLEEQYEAIKTGNWK